MCCAFDMTFALFLRWVCEEFDVEGPVRNSILEKSHSYTKSGGANLQIELTHASKASVVVLLPPPLILAFLAEEISGDLATSPPFLDLVCGIPLLVV